MPDEPPIQHGVDMEAYDAALIEAGFEFVEGTDEEIELWFLAAPDAEVELASPAEPEAPAKP